MNNRNQKEWLLEIIKLSDKNPDCEIHFCVDSDDVLESGWTGHKIIGAEIIDWFQDDNRIYTGEDEIREHFEESYYEVNEDKSEEEIEKLVNEKYEKEVKEVICIYTRAR